MAGAVLRLPQNHVNISKEKFSGIDVEMKGAHPSLLIRTTGAVRGVQDEQ
jgi:hypothetical protein